MIRFTRGDTFSAAGTLAPMVNGQAVASLVGWSADASVMHEGDVVATATDILHPENSAVLIRFDSTEAWPLGMLTLKLRVVAQDGTRRSARPVPFICAP